jgi:hypothetical protein
LLLFPGITAPAPVSKSIGASKNPQADGCRGCRQSSLLLCPDAALPAAGRHRPDRLDLGLIVDFWLCVVLYGVIELVDRKWQSSG